MIFGLGGKYCPACRARMNERIVTHRAIDAEGQPVTYHGVRHYTCPNGCHTSIYDFRDAYIDDPNDGPRGWQPFGARQAAADASVGRFDLAYWISVVGLLLGYVFFIAAIIASNTSPVGKIVCGVALTLAAFYVLFALTTREGESGEDGQDHWGLNLQ